MTDSSEQESTDQSKKIFSHDAWNAASCSELHQAEENNTAAHETEQISQEKNWDSACAMIQESCQTQQDSNILDYECDFNNSSQHIH